MDKMVILGGDLNGHINYLLIRKKDTEYLSNVKAIPGEEALS